MVTLNQSDKYIIKGYEESQFIFVSLGGLYIYRFNKYGEYLSVFGTITICILMVAAPMILLDTILHCPDDVQIVLESIHYISLIGSFTLAFFNFILKREHLNKYLCTIGSGLYKYSKENFSVAQLKILNSGKYYIRRLAKTLLGITTAACTCLTLTPLYHSIIADDKSKKIEGINSKLPAKMVFRFNTFTSLGYLEAYMIQLLITFGTNFVCVGCDVGYAAIITHFRNNFKILNYSIRNIENRAKQRYYTNHAASKMIIHNNSTFIDDENFQKCLYDCLKENIKHHHALIKYYNTVKPLLNNILLIMLLNGAAMMSVTGYLIVKTQDSFRSLVYCFLIAAELFHIFILCFYGQLSIDESKKTFDELYKCSWHNYDKKFKKSLLLMMTGTIRPKVYRMNIIKTTASLETFGAILSSSYSYFNIIRGMT